jgi:hypothetical protein
LQYLISFVDWEYSAENHRSYDLSLFSIKSSLTPQQEQKLVTAYDPLGSLNMQYSVAMMKPIVNFLLLLWNLSSKQGNAITANTLLHSLTISIQDVIYKQFARSLLSETKFGLFSNKENIESMPDKKLSPKYLTI